MRPDLLNRLHERYPRLFRAKGGNSPDVTQQPPIEIGDGWFGIVDALCSTLQIIDPETEIKHIRRRFRYLRFVSWPTNPATYGAIHTAQAFSMRICEATGSTFYNLPDISLGETGLPLSFIDDGLNAPSPALSPGFFNLIDMGFRFISKRSPLRSGLPMIKIETISWDNAQGLILTPSMASIRATTIAQIERATMCGTRRGHKGQIDKHLEKMLGRTKAASLFIAEMSKRMDPVNGRCRPVDHDGKLGSPQTSN